MRVKISLQNGQTNICNADTGKTIEGVVEAMIHMTADDNIAILKFKDFDLFLENIEGIVDSIMEG